MGGMHLETFDPLDPAFARDPYAVYDRLRDEGPVYHEVLGMWLLARARDVRTIATDATCVRSLEGFAPEEESRAHQIAENFHDMPNHARFVQTSLLDSDGEKHRRLRHQIFAAFRPNALERLRPDVDDLVERFLAPLIGSGSFDFTGDFAAEIPGRVIGRFLGVPEEDCPTLRSWTQTVVSYFDIGRTNAKKIAAEQATADFADYLRVLVREREAAPKDDLVSTMIAARDAGNFSDDELISTTMLILMAGHGSTIDVLGSGMHLLLRHEAARSGLKAGSLSLPIAIQEMFRVEPPLPFFHRHATRSVTLGDRTFEPGTTFGLLYGGANRDPDAFDRPNTFDAARRPNRHVSFGLGAHLCLGNALGLLSMEAVFKRILQADTMRLEDEDVHYRPGLTVRGPEALQVSLA